MKVVAEDIVGQPFGQWTVLSVVEQKRGEWYYLCKCKCGAEGTHARKTLRAGKTMGCRGCAGASRRTYKVGDEVNQWTVIDVIGGNSNLYKCQCKCGTVSMVVGANMRRGLSRNCVNCGNVNRRTGIDGMIWGNVCRMAKDRSIAVEMTMEQAREILERQEFKCALTGVPIDLPTCKADYRKHKHTASFDRIDSDGAYTIDNVQWVHKDVNRMKNAFPEDRFLEICRLVVSHHAAKLAEPSTAAAPPTQSTPAEAYQIQA